jgi:hypothetical protein
MPRHTIVLLARGCEPVVLYRLPIRLSRKTVDEQGDTKVG